MHECYFHSVEVEYIYERIIVGKTKYNHISRTVKYFARVGDPFTNTDPSTDKKSHAK